MARSQPEPLSGTEGLIGHARVMDQLWLAMRSGTSHQAYLFEGPSGVGRAAVALRVAMAANCETATELWADGRRPPCGECRTCRLIARGGHPDVLLIEPDGAFIKVGQVREVVRKVGFHRFGGTMRVVIIDPGEAMAAPAANALLKTLEEPPEGTVFILITSNARALLPTIVSRTQRVRFSAVPEDALRRWLDEKNVPDSELIARLALGRPGAALALAEGGLAERRELQQCVLGVIDRGDAGEIFETSKALCSGDRRSWVPKVKATLDILEDLLRDVTLHGAGSDLPIMEAALRDVTERWAHSLWPSGVWHLVDAIEEAREGLARNAQGRVVLDALFMRFATEVRGAQRR